MTDNDRILSEWAITDIILRTGTPRGDYGQHIVVYARLDDGREVELIREFGALPDISIDHSITHHGICSAVNSGAKKSAGEEA